MNVPTHMWQFIWLGDSTTRPIIDRTHSISFIETDDNPLFIMIPWQYYPRLSASRVKVLFGNHGIIRIRERRLYTRLFLIDASVFVVKIVYGLFVGGIQGYVLSRTANVQPKQQFRGSRHSAVRWFSRRRGKQSGFIVFTQQYRSTTMMMTGQIKYL